MDTDVRDEAEVQAEAERNQRTLAAMAEAGQATETGVAVDYFAFDETIRVELPDGVSWVEHKPLNEGARRQYLNKVNKEVRVEKVTGDARIPMASGDERHTLLSVALSGWNLQRGGQPVKFSPQTVKEFLDKANPRIIDIIEKSVRKNNPWLLAELSVEDIDKQIAELQEMREVAVKEQEGKDN